MFSQKLEMALVTAVRQAKNHRHEFVTVEHLLYGILQDDLINRIIKRCGGSLENLQKRLEKFFDGELPTQKISGSQCPGPDSWFQPCSAEGYWSRPELRQRRGRFRRYPGGDFF